MTEHIEYDDANRKIIGVEQGPRKMSIVYGMCTSIKTPSRREPSSRNLMVNRR